ncbi:hypothetical protein [Filimonas effusa]|uniref:Uncharacterized protein n=1 Tax=Filimonas effusa TaxID=2508721 RepID=A0A4Q1D5M8_9BACT|nr:hypothetical protein [Filimonas effusa]RXK82927.1 hypothetical protein ESB13_12425 [Filimonas effusa]
MKTSNKILAGIVVLAFGLPVLSAFIIKAKIAKGDCITRRIEPDEVTLRKLRRPLPAGDFSVVKFSGVGGNLSCTLYGSDTSGYSTKSENIMGDSVRLHCLNDTLYVDFIQKPRKGTQVYYDIIKMALFVKSAKTIVVSETHLTIANPGEISSDLSVKIQADTPYGSSTSVLVQADRPDYRSGRKLTLDANGGSILIHPSNPADTLALELRGDTKLELPVPVHHVIGRIGDSVEVKGNWKELRELPRR